MAGEGIVPAGPLCVIHSPEAGRVMTDRSSDRAALGRVWDSGLAHRLLNEVEKPFYAWRRPAQGAIAAKRALVDAVRDRAPIAPADTDILKAIEAERRAPTKDPSALLDGTLGVGGPWDDGQTVSAAARVSKSAVGGQVLYRLARAFRSRTAIELGTNVGISAAYLATALRANGPDGQLVTLDASPYRLRLARRVHERLGLMNVRYVEGLFADTLPGVLNSIDVADFAFIDGHHQYQPTIDYFNLVWRRSADGAVFVFDDIRWSAEMRLAWSELQTGPRTRASIDLGGVGVIVSAA